jgi:hypothetical protein
MTRNSLKTLLLGATFAVFAAACTETPNGFEPDSAGPEIAPPSLAVSQIGTINNPTVDNRLDMTVVNNTESINGACFIAAPSGGATGTGLYKPFKRVNVNRTWFQAWNTGTRPIPVGE